MSADTKRKIDALDAVAGQLQIITDATTELDRQIARALHYGAIAAVLGVTRQSAHERYRTLRYNPTRRFAWREPPLPL